ncbi:MFS general substrate transporter [Acephala macrosclerotiorum]|nr:MFS general substrate transporter [Acephala macrosclerotiorum]
MSVFEHDDDPIVTRLANEDTVPWYKKPHQRNPYLILFPACMGIEMTSRFDSQLINALQFIPPFNKCQYINPTTYQLAVNPPLLGIINASYSLGAICAVPVAPYFNQLVGRRWAIMSGSIAMVVGDLLQGFAQHVAMYTIVRMLLGFGIVFAIISGPTIIESPRHLISKDREEEAFEILVKCHAEGDRDSLFVRAEMTETKTTIKIEMEISKQIGEYLISYYLSTILGMIGYNTTFAKMRINSEPPFHLKIANQCRPLTSTGIATVTVTRVPRRRMFLLCTISMLFVFAGWTISMEKDLSANSRKLTNNSAAIAALFFIFAYSTCYNIRNDTLTYSKDPSVRCESYRS